METQEKSNEPESKKTISKEKLLELYMDHVLENGEAPKSVYKFAKDNKFTEAEFYTHFGNFESLGDEIWNEFFCRSLLLIEKDQEWENYSSREKLLLFYFTFFENLNVNRSYILCSLTQKGETMQNLRQLKALRNNMKKFAKELIQEEVETQEYKFFKRNGTIFSEGIWVQTLFLLRFWMKDNSANFEKTDIAIEKSVNTAFDLFNTAPLERMMDFGKFLWKEKVV
ncbi:MAG TPA: TetR family transcriptional regulator C-terminal domain-containing protein [Flavobacteriaceae bacterium]|nr:TetR family transcriptional regulator C-terminal domain-containing protein [Flavobacteriaceae bacterium]